MFQKNRYQSIHYKDRRRLLVLSFFIFALFSCLVIQFYKIQIIDGEKWAKHANAQHQLYVVEPFTRGVFYSNVHIKEGHPDIPQPLVMDVPKFHLYIDPMMIPVSFRQEIYENLNGYLDLTEEELSKMRMQFDRDSRSRLLKMWIDHETKNAIMTWWLPYAKKRKIPSNAVYFLKEFHRKYPFGSLLGAVLHTLRETRDVETHQRIPTGGLELYFDEYLKGKDGMRLLLRSPRRPLETGQVISHPEHGADIYLTINHYLQAIAEEEITKAVQQASATSGWAVMMDSNTGEVLALAQYPSFFPSHYREYYNDPNLVEWTQVKSVTDCFEPGSTIKPISAAIALHANDCVMSQGKPPIFSPHEKVYVGNGHFPGRSHPMKDVGSYKYLNLNLAMQKSSNIYFSKLIQRVVDHLGAEWYRDQLQSIFGFGVSTGMELPSESHGFLPQPGKDYASGRPEWSTPTPYTLAIGYNMMSTTMQVLKAYAVIANGGYQVKPTLLRKIVQKGEVIFDNTQNFALQKRVLSPEICDVVTRALKFVTKVGGSGTRADIHGFTEAGKTSTSEKIVNGVYSKRVHFSSFVGFVPAHSSRFVLFIGINEPEYRYISGIGKSHYGGRCAAPVFKSIMERSLRYLGVEPDDPCGYPKGDPRADATHADYTSEIFDLKELYNKWN